MDDGLRSVDTPRWAQLQQELSAGGRVLAAKRKRGGGKRQPARAGAYVSIGKVRAFTGDVYPSSSLALALESRSYKRELILITDTRPRAALQLYENLAQLGLVHAMWLTTSQATCAVMDGLLAARAELQQRRLGATQQQQQQAGVGGGVGGAGGGAARRATKAVDPRTDQLPSTRDQSRLQQVQDDGTADVGAARGSSRSVLAATAAASTSAYNISDVMIGITAAAAAATGLQGNIGAGPVLAPDDAMGCAWYSQPFPEAFGGHRRLMTKRLIVLARAVRLGYNVLSLDTDLVVFRDPYPFLKSPPYSSMHIVGGRSIRGGSILNTGVMYVQNAARQGPVFQLLSDVVVRNLRWVDHGTSAGAAGAGSGAAAGAALLMPYQADSRGCWDQLLFGDAVLTSMTGKMTLFYCARPAERVAGASAAVGARAGGGRKNEDDNGWVAKHREALGLVEKLGPMDMMVREVITVSDAGLAALVAADMYTTHWVNITIPSSLPPLLPDEPGYRLPAIKDGGSAERFQQLLEEDDGHVKVQARRSGSRRRHRARRRLLGRDDGVSAAEGVAAAGLGHSDGLLANDQVGEKGDWRGRQLQQSDAALGTGGGGVGGGVSGDALPPVTRDVERLAYAADWLIAGWSQRGVLGYWDPSLTKNNPKQVFAHLVRAPGPTSVGKEAVRMQYGEYNWDLAALSEGGPYPFISSSDAAETPRVVALLPNVDTTTLTPNQWSNMARGLVQVALLTGRRVVWPSVPCASKWVQPNPGSRRALPLNMNLRFLAHGTFSQGLLCTPVAVFHPKCLYERLVNGRNDSDAGGSSNETSEYSRREGPRGLLPAEFAMLVQLLPPLLGQPGPRNTVHLMTNDDYEDGDGADRPVMFDEPPRAEGIAYVKASAVSKALRAEPLAAQPVLYLAQRTFLTQLDKLEEPDLMAKYRTFRNECPALK